MAEAARRLRIAIIAPVNTHQYNDRLLEPVQPVLPPDVDVSVHNLHQGHVLTYGQQDNFAGIAPRHCCWAARALSA